MSVETHECRLCGVELSAPNRTPFCAADWPSECPKCGCENIGWSVVRRQAYCDNGCSFMPRVFPADADFDRGPEGDKS